MYNVNNLKIKHCMLYLCLFFNDFSLYFLVKLCTYINYPIHFLYFSYKFITHYMKNENIVCGYN